MTVSSARPSSDSESPELRSGDIHVFLSRHTTSVASGPFIAKLLSGYTGMPPERLEFERGKYGKPYLVNAPVPLHFSLSHSAEWMAVAVSGDTPVGLDLEYRDPDRDILKLARRFYHSSEYEFIAALDRARQNAMFYDLWTLKEAWIKARGGALGRDLEATIFVPGDLPACCRLLQALPGYSLALCSLEPIGEVRYMHSDELHRDHGNSATAH